MVEKKPTIDKLVEKFKDAHKNKKKAIESIMDRKFKDVDLQKKH
jgi:hypothetical protein